ncbi:MAG: hypothetical protein ACXABY_04075 [Candidatus Thorarchaeota archaeon]
MLKKIGMGILIAVLFVFMATMFTIVGQVGTSVAAKALYKGDVGVDDIYEAFVAVVVDMGTIKDAVDEGNNDLKAQVNVLVTLANEVKSDFNTHVARLAMHNGVANTTGISSTSGTAVTITNSVGTLTTTTP